MYYKKRLTVMFGYNYTCDRQTDSIINSLFFLAYKNLYTTNRKYSTTM